MGTTVAGLAMTRFAGSPHWAVFNVGDSRVYRFADNHLERMTVDHTEVAELVALGVISEAAAMDHPRRHVVTRALGTDPPPDADLRVFPPVPGERFLICSDGLPLELADASIAAVLAGEPDPQRVANSLVRQAVEAGGRDNVTVVVVDHRLVPQTATDAETVPRSRPVMER